MTTKSKDDFISWYKPDAVLREEANAIHTGKKRWKDSAEAPKAPGPAPTKADQKPAAGKTDDTDKSEDRPWEDIPPGLEGNDLRIALYDRHSTALCLSGGGIRSASFNVGVIEALAVHPRPDTSDSSKGDEQIDDPLKSFLSQFHYLSTVSGGGYIGSWLSAWIARDGYDKVWRKLVGRRERPERSHPRSSGCAATATS